MTWFMCYIYQDILMYKINVIYAFKVVMLWPINDLWAQPGSLTSQHLSLVVRKPVFGVSDQV